MKKGARIIRLFYERPTYDVRSKRSDVRCVLKRAEPLLLNLSASALLMRDQRTLRPIHNDFLYTCLAAVFYFFIATLILTGFLTDVLFFNSSFIALIILDLLSENSLGTNTYLKT